MGEPQRLDTAYVDGWGPQLRDHFVSGVGRQMRRSGFTYVIQFFQSPLLGFWNEEEDHDEGYHIQAA